MASLTIEETFTVAAPIDLVWDYFVHPQDMVVCLPGASLESVEDERIFHGNMKVKVGPVTVTYKGKMTLTEADEVAHTMQMEGVGREKGGKGSAKMTMSCSLVNSDDGVQVNISADVDLAGRIVRFGRGMIKSVSKQLFKQFVTKFEKLLAAAQAAQDETGETEPPPDESRAASGENAPSEVADDDLAPGESAESAASDDVEAGKSSAPGADSPASQDPDSNPETASAVTRDDSESESNRPPAKKPRTRVRLGPEQESEPIRAIPLIFKAIWASIVSFFRRVLRLK